MVPDSPYGLQEEPHTVLQAASIAVGSPVYPPGEELLEEIAVGSVDLDGVVSLPARAG